MKMTAKQFKAKRIYKRNQNAIDALGRDARKESNKYNQVTITGRSCDTMRNAKGLQVYTPDGTQDTILGQDIRFLINYLSVY